MLINSTGVFGCEMVKLLFWLIFVQAVDVGSLLLIL